MKLNRSQLRTLIESLIKENDVDGIEDYNDPDLRKLSVLLKDDGTLKIKFEKISSTRKRQDFINSLYPKNLI